jgi:hypothetical protein
MLCTQPVRCLSIWPFPSSPLVTGCDNFMVQGYAYMGANSLSLVFDCCHSWVINANRRWSHIWMARFISRIDHMIRDD